MAVTVKRPQPPDRRGLRAFISGCLHSACLDPALGWLIKLPIGCFLLLERLREQPGNLIHAAGFSQGAQRAVVGYLVVLDLLP